MKVTGNGVTGAVGQGRAALLPGLEVPRVNGTWQILQASQLSCWRPTAAAGR